MLLTTAGALVNGALAAESQPINGMYIFFTNNSSVPLDPIEESVVSGGTIQAVTSAAVNNSAGVIRVHPIVAVGTTSGGGMVYIGNTANYNAADIGSGLVFEANKYIRAVGLAHISPAGSNHDIGLDFTELDTPIIVPGGGTVTVRDTVTISGGVISND